MPPNKSSINNQLNEKFVAIEFYQLKLVLALFCDVMPNLVRNLHK